MLGDQGLPSEAGLVPPFFLRSAAALIRAENKRMRASVCAHSVQIHRPLSSWKRLDAKSKRIAKRTEYGATPWGAGCPGPRPLDSLGEGERSRAPRERSGAHASALEPLPDSTSGRAALRTQQSVRAEKRLLTTLPRPSQLRDLRQRVRRAPHRRGAGLGQESWPPPSSRHPAVKRGHGPACYTPGQVHFRSLTHRPENVWI